MQHGNKVRVSVIARVTIRVMATAWVTVRFSVVFCSNIGQFLTILRIPPHYADGKSVWR